MRLLAAGSIALDSLEGPFGRVHDQLGGSALYFSLAASLIRPVEIVAPVGADAIAEVRSVIAERAIDLSRISILDRPTYRWSASQESGTNVDLGSLEDIYDGWEPDLPGDFDGWAFVGSMRPDRQLAVARRLRAASRLLAGDSMRSYLTSHRAEAEDLLEACGWFFANREELAALGGDPERPQLFRERWGLEGLTVKAGSAGCTVWTAAGPCHLGALSGHPVVDVTGAGDALAGGMLAAWIDSGGDPGELPGALAHGIACASLAISTVGLAGLAQATPKDLAERVAEVLAAS